MQDADSPNYFRTTLLFEAALGAAACLLGWLVGLAPWQAFAWRWEDVLWGIVATAPAVALLLLTSWVRRGPLDRLNRLVDQIAQSLFGRCTLVQLALIALAAGVGEELMFRGFLQPLLSRYLGPTAALFIASLAFGLAHALSKTYALLATLIGVYLGLLWLVFDNLLVPTAVHALYDFIALVYLLRLRDQQKS